jgi:hypothetical protein
MSEFFGWASPNKNLSSIFSNSGSNDLDNKDDVDSGDELDGKKIDNEEVRMLQLLCMFYVYVYVFM